MYQQCIMLKPAPACKKLGWRLMVLKKVILRFVIANQERHSQKVGAETNKALMLNNLRVIPCEKSEKKITEFFLDF